MSAILYIRDPATGKKIPIRAIKGADGKDGKDGENGIVPRIGENGTWWLGDIDTGIRAAKTYELIAQYTEAGTYSWECPETGTYIALIIGGGGSGAIHFEHTFVSTEKNKNIVAATGGGSGFWGVSKNNFSHGQTIALTVGEGGASITTTIKKGNYSNSAQNGNDGLPSSFNGVTAKGGRGGNYGGASALGGQSSRAFDQAFSTRDECARSILPFVPFGGDLLQLGIFVDELGDPITHLCAGGLAAIVQFNQQYYDVFAAKAGEDSSKNIVLSGKTCSPGVTAIGDEKTSLTSIQPTDVGAGSGGVAYSANTSGGINEETTLTSGKGADGGVFIFRYRGE